MFKAWKTDNKVPIKVKMENTQRSFFNFFLNKGGTSIAMITATVTRIPTTTNKGDNSFLYLLNKRMIYSLGGCSLYLHIHMQDKSVYSIFPFCQLINIFQSYILSSCGFGEDACSRLIFFWLIKRGRVRILHQGTRIIVSLLSLPIKGAKGLI